MNSFKKVSLIIAAALTSTMLVSPAANANAGTVTLTVAGSAATGGTVVTTPVALPVPADNSIDAADALKIAVTSVDTGTVVTAVAVNATIVPALATSAVAAEFVGRNWVGIELSPNYTEVANKRLLEYRAKLLQMKLELEEVSKF